MNPTDLATKQTAATLVEEYRKAMDMVREANQKMHDAQEILDAAFGRESYVYFTPEEPSRYYPDVDKAYKNIESKIRRKAWRRILGLSQIRKMLSNERTKELDERLEKGELPEINLEEVLSMLDTLLQNSGNFIKEAALEAWETLRPGAKERWGGEYKTNVKNSKYEINGKIILTWRVERKYGGDFRVYYGREQSLIVVDRVFYALDGKLKDMESSHYSPLVDAINTSGTEGKGETEYFSFKCYKNGNLHLDFKRMDLVKKLNALCGGITLTVDEMI